jgi:hypothetical protein
LTLCTKTPTRKDGKRHLKYCPHRPGGGVANHNLSPQNGPAFHTDRAITGDRLAIINTKTSRCLSQVAQSLLLSLAVIQQLYVCSNLTHRLLPARISAVESELGFQSPPKAFNGSVIVAVPIAAHRGVHVESPKQFSLFTGTILPATVGMMNKACRCPFAGNRLEQGLTHKISGHATAHGIADNRTGAQSLVSGEIQPVFICRDGRDLGQPDLTRSISHKTLIQQVGYYRLVMV